MRKETFTLKQEHFDLLSKSWVQWQGDEFGAPEIDPKRPYGNSDVFNDIHRILTGEEWDYDEEEEMPLELENTYRKLHEETETALQVILNNLGGFCPPGEYQREPYGGKWELVFYECMPIVK